MASAFAAFDDAIPPGGIAATDIDNLNTFAKTKGFDLVAELGKVYENNDSAALSRVFKFSAEFSAFDVNAQTYGKIIFNSLMNLGEAWGSEPYLRVLLAQSPAVQQRIRDFLLYQEVVAFPGKERKQLEKEAKERSPQIYSNDYKFGQGNALFLFLPNSMISFSSIDNYIVYQEKVSVSEEFKSARAVQCNERVCYVLFTLENGNDYKQRLAALRIDNKLYTIVDDIVVGGRGTRSVDSISIVNDKVVLGIKKFGDNDPICCPSIPSSATFIIKENMLIPKK